VIDNTLLSEEQKLEKGLYPASAKATGGRRDYVIGISAVPDILKAYANALAMQYEVTFKRPETAKEVKQIQVGTQPGLKVHASSAPSRLTA